MKNTPIIPIYASTLALSAALLFAMQPMFSKMILPLLGGAPQVWNTAMMFFQVLLLAGYGYAHLAGRYLSVRAQTLFHAALLIVFMVALPVAIPENWPLPESQNPALWQLTLMTLTVGGPFFVLAGSAPLLQRWFAGSSHTAADNPYFLYTASNMGSLSALLAYPVLIEPLLTLEMQSKAWTAGYILLIGLCVLTAAFIWGNKGETRTETGAEHIAWALRGRWLLLALIPSSLMLGVTTFITTDIASVPLLWIVPLALYVTTFVIAFAHRPLLSSGQAALLQGILVTVLIVQIMTFRLDTLPLVLLHLVLFFTSALTCHLALAESRPGAGNLTEFYLILGTGGALGGVFNALLAPQLFIIPYEYALALAACCFMRYAGRRETFPKLHLEIVAAGGAAALASAGTPVLPHALLALLGFALALCLATLISRRWLFALAAGFCLLLFPPGYISGHAGFKTLHQDRSFFGVVRVIDTLAGERLLMHGTTHHGSQALDERHKLEPLSYYYKGGSPLADVFALLDTKPGPQNIAVLGLGTGSAACYSKKVRRFDFFEINPQVVQIAQNPVWFTFLKDCGSPYEITPGDGRLSMTRMPDRSYDFILLDAFSSDNIPVHLLTAEAIEIYRRKLKPGGLLAFHISNNHLDLEPVLARAAAEAGVSARARMTGSGLIRGTKLNYFPAHYLVMTVIDADLIALERNGWDAARQRPGIQAWTDEFSNIVSVLRNRTGNARLREATRNK
jgi:hypothetical protein